MSAQTQPSLFTQVQRHRNGKRWRIYDFFLANLHKEFSSDGLHKEWGSSVRTRISEINRDPQSEIHIHNRTGYSQQLGTETSFYWASRKPA